MKIDDALSHCELLDRHAELAVTAMAEKFEAEFLHVCGCLELCDNYEEESTLP